MQAKQQKQQNNVLLLACTRGYTADVSRAVQSARSGICLLSRLGLLEGLWLMSLQAQQLVQTGAQITARDKRGCTTLHFAAAHGQLDVVTYLWSKGAELDWETPGRELLRHSVPGSHACCNVQMLICLQHVQMALTAAGCLSVTCVESVLELLKHMHMAT